MLTGAPFAIASRASSARSRPRPSATGPSRPASSSGPRMRTSITGGLRRPYQSRFTASLPRRWRKRGRRARRSSRQSPTKEEQCSTSTTHIPPPARRASQQLETARLLADAGAPRRRPHAGAVALAAVVAVVVATLLAATTQTASAYAAANEVVRWNQIAEDTVVTSGAFQNEGLLYMSYVSAAVYDAVVAIEGGYEPYASTRPGAADRVGRRGRRRSRLPHPDAVLPAAGDGARGRTTSSRSPRSQTDGKSQGLDVGRTAALQIRRHPRGRRTAQADRRRRRRSRSCRRGRACGGSPHRRSPRRRRRGSGGCGRSCSGRRTSSCPPPPPSLGEQELDGRVRRDEALRRHDGNLPLGRADGDREVLVGQRHPPVQPAVP